MSWCGTLTIWPTPSAWQCCQVLCESRGVSMGVSWWFLHGTRTIHGDWWWHYECNYREIYGKICVFLDLWWFSWRLNDWINKNGDMMIQEIPSGTERQNYGQIHHAHEQTRLSHGFKCAKGNNYQRVHQRLCLLWVFLDGEYDDNFSIRWSLECSKVQGKSNLSRYHYHHLGPYILSLGSFRLQYFTARKSNPNAITRCSMYDMFTCIWLFLRVNIPASWSVQPYLHRQCLDP